MGRAWSRRGVQLLLTNPKYIGSNVYNRESVNFDIKRVRNPPDMWIRRDAAFAAIVPLEHFLKAQAIIQARTAYLSDQSLLEQLTRLWQKVGRLSETLINKAVDMPCSETFHRRFKTLRNAYSLIGYLVALKDSKPNEIGSSEYRHMRASLKHNGLDGPLMSSRCAVTSASLCPGLHPGGWGLRGACRKQTDDITDGE